MSGYRQAVARLVHVHAKQERANLAPWIALLTALAVTSMLAFAWVFPDAAAQATLQQTVASNPAFRLIFGPAHDLTSGEGFTAWRSGQLAYLFSGLMAILLTVRITRAKEDSGEAELVASTAVPRGAQLLSGVAFSALAALLLGIVSTLATIAFGGRVDQIPFITGGYVASALLFGAVTSVTSQVAADSRSASTYAIVILAAAFLTRGTLQVLDAPAWTNWLTPFGALTEVGAPNENNLLPFATILLAAFGLWLLAFQLQSRRDFGRGLVEVRPGRSTWHRRAPLLRLVLRLNRGPLLTWTYGMSVIGGVFGYLATSMSDLFTSNPQFAAAIASGVTSRELITFEFLGMLLKLAGLMAAVAAASMIQRLAVEEDAKRADPLLSGALPRWRHFAAYTLTALVMAALLTVWAGALMGLVSSRVDEAIHSSDVLLQAIATIPATLVLAGVSIAATGARPKARVVGWMAIVAAFALTILAPLFNLWDWVNGISPYWHVPVVVAAAPNWWSLLGLAAVATALTAIGFAGYQRRNIG